MAQFGLILEISSHNKNALVRLVNGYCMNTGVGNLIPVTTEQLNRQELGERMGRIGCEFTHFVSIGLCEGVDLEQIKAFQDKMGDVPGIGRKKNPRKMHITLGVFNLLDDEIKEAEIRFKKVGQKFSDLASPGSFLVNMKGLEMGDGSQVLFAKVYLGREMLEILRGLFEDELGDKLTDMRFMPHVTLFDECTLDPVTRENLFRTADVMVGPTIRASSMSFRQRHQQRESGEQQKGRVVAYTF